MIFLRFGFLASRLAAWTWLQQCLTYLLAHISGLSTCHSCQKSSQLLFGLVRYHASSPSFHHNEFILVVFNHSGDWLEMSSDVPGLAGLHAVLHWRSGTYCDGLDLGPFYKNSSKQVISLLFLLFFSGQGNRSNRFNRADWHSDWHFFLWKSKRPGIGLELSDHSIDATRFQGPLITSQYIVRISSLWNRHTDYVIRATLEIDGEADHVFMEAWRGHKAGFLCVPFLLQHSLSGEIKDMIEIGFERFWILVPSGQGYLLLLQLHLGGQIVMHVILRVRTLCWSAAALYIS